jgi:hypothetical protein
MTTKDTEGARVAPSCPATPTTSADEILDPPGDFHIADGPHGRELVHVWPDSLVTAGRVPADAPSVEDGDSLVYQRVPGSDRDLFMIHRREGRTVNVARVTMGAHHCPLRSFMQRREAPRSNITE